MWNKRYVIGVGLITAAILAIGGLLWSSEKGELSGDAIEWSISPWYLGDEDALVTIDMYPDFECGICVDKEHMAKLAYADFPSKIRLVYHHYASTSRSEKIAEALEAAGEQGRFWELHDQLIDDEPCDIAKLIAAAKSTGVDMDTLIFSHLVTEAENIGLEIEKFTEALESGRFIEKVRLAKQEAELAGVKYVSVFINGKEYQKYPGTLDDFYTAINEELERLGVVYDD